VLSIAILWVVTISRGEIIHRPIPAPRGILEYDLNLIAPTQLGIEQWQVGDYARYRKTERAGNGMPSPPRLVDFHIIGELDESDTLRHWMKITGFRSFRKKFPLEYYRLITASDLKLSPPNRSYRYMPNYVPQLIKSDQTKVPPAKLIEIGPAAIQTEAGTFECVLYHAVLSDQETILKAWTTSEVPPLGIVRVESETEMMELISYGQKVDFTIPTLLQPVFQGVSKLKESCTACHEYGNCHERIFPPK